ncbi:MAG: UDP-N-acetylmuramate dehydrogenase [Candidatus Stygibacter australis]|nr:UDP-N-acetylmuramate dehydrogenase [Candidatus Stygibacter australis]MDP8323041.1 UDP-N-acetylmuramate dehydrogenase [Candidatus Stygibacter australis]
MSLNKIKAHTVDLSKWSHIRIGAPYHDFYLPENQVQLIELLNNARGKDKSLLFLAGGSNILFGNTSRYIIISDAFLPCFWKREGKNIIVSGNYNISRLLMEMSRLDLGGMEFLAGIPAHISGLVKMNAGAFGTQISDFIKYIKLINAEGEIKKISGSDLDFSYRHSDISGFITEICLSPESKPQIKILNDIKAKINDRRAHQPLNMPNLGSIFKNPLDASAGYLLDKAGFKGKSLGDAAFSSLHANIMVNLGKADFSDALQLIDNASEAVLRTFHIELELEIKVVN